MAFIMSIGMFLVGAALSFWAGKRAFERRNQVGVEMHKSYGSAVGSQAVEKLALLLGRVLMLLGALFTVMMWFGDQAGG